jgi:type II restriction enzyme
MNANDIHKALVAANVFQSNGTISFSMLGINIKLTDSSIVGNVIQEWLKSFLTHQGLAFRLKPNTQEFPDFLLHPTRNDIDQMEVKCFTKSPNFDVANFAAYVRSIVSDPYRLDADYLIFEYEINTAGVSIKNIWVKKVWELCGPSQRSPVKIQWKQSTPVNIRPAVWYANRSQFQPFTSRLQFVQELEKVVNMSGVAQNIQKNWFRNVSSTYQKQTGQNL